MDESKKIGTKPNTRQVGQFGFGGHPIAPQSCGWSMEPSPIRRIDISIFGLVKTKRVCGACNPGGRTMIGKEQLLEAVPVTDDGGTICMTESGDPMPEITGGGSDNPPPDSDDPPGDAYSVSRIRLRAWLNHRDMKPKEAARLAGMGNTFVYDILSGRTQNLRPDSIKKLAKVLKISVTQLLNEMPSSRAETKAVALRPLTTAKIRTMPVIGVAQTGAVINSEYVALRRHEIICPPSERYPHARTDAVEVRDLAMDRTTFPLVLGSYAAFFYFENGITLQDGTIAVIRIRHSNGLEMFIRRVRFDAEHVELLAESSMPSRYQVIRIDAPLSTDPSAEIHALGQVYMSLGHFRDQN